MIQTTHAPLRDAALRRPAFELPPAMPVQVNLRFHLRSALWWLNHLRLYPKPGYPLPLFGVCIVFPNKLLVTCIITFSTRLQPENLN